jgi:hypothetical protein
MDIARHVVETYLKDNPNADGPTSYRIRINDFIATRIPTCSLKNSNPIKINH